MDLNAVIITPMGAIAWIRTPKEPKLQKIQVGDELEGWKVKAIQRDEVEMEGPSGGDRLVLRRFDQSGQQGAPKPNPPAGRAEGRRPATPNRPPPQQASAKEKTKAVPAKPNRPPAPPSK